MPDHLRVDEFSYGKWPESKEQTPAQLPETQAAPKRIAATHLRARLSISQMTTKRWSLEDDLRGCRALGLKHIGLWRLKYEDYGEDRTAALLQRLQLKPSSISWVGGYTGANGYLLDDHLEESEQVIRFASWVGAPTVVVATGEQGGHILSHATRLTVQSLQYLGDIAEDLGVHLAVMPMSPAAAHGWTFLKSLRKTESLLEQCDHPQVGLCLNSYHLLQNRHWKSELANLLPSIKLVRLCDGRSSKRPKMQVLPCQGKMPLLGLVDHLEEAGYGGLYEIDTWSDDVWQAEDIGPFQECLNQFLANFSAER